MRHSHLEQQFAQLWVELYPAIDLHAEHRFFPGRRFRLDFAHLPTLTAIELDGGTWSNGRHSRGRGYAKDCEKFNLAASRGWAVFRLTGAMLEGENAAKWLELIAATIEQRQEVAA